MNRLAVTCVVLVGCYSSGEPNDIETDPAREPAPSAPATDDGHAYAGALAPPVTGAEPPAEPPADSVGLAITHEWRCAEGSLLYVATWTADRVLHIVCAENGTRHEQRGQYTCSPRPGLEMTMAGTPIEEGGAPYYRVEVYADGEYRGRFPCEGGKL